MLIVGDKVNTFFLNYEIFAAKSCERVGRALRMMAENSGWRLSEGEFSPLFVLEADLCKNQVIKDLLTPLLISFLKKNEIIVGNCGEILYICTLFN